MKKAISTLALCAVIALAGCAKAAEVTADGNSVTLSDAAVTIDFPQEYTVIVGDRIYEVLSGSMSSYSSAEELKAEYEESGIRYLAQATDGNTIIVVSAQDMTPDEDTERTTLDDYARQVHDTTIFEYYASGYRTTENTSLTEAAYGGKDGWVSFFEVITPEDESQFVIGYIEFMFEQGSDIYSIQIGLPEQTDRDTAAQMFEWIKAE